jgi:hypothetical protein
LGAKPAVFGTSARFDIYNRAEVNPVAFEMLTDAIGSSEQFKDFDALLQVKQEMGVSPGNHVAGDDTPGESGDPVGIICVN